VGAACSFYGYRSLRLAKYHRGRFVGLRAMRLHIYVDGGKPTLPLASNLGDVVLRGARGSRSKPRSCHMESLAQRQAESR
jgi:hypothetical protein